MKSFLSFISGIFLTLLICSFAIYNWLNSQKLEIYAQCAKVEAYYDKRFDLIPTLVKAVKEYMAQDKKILKELSEAHQLYAGAVSVSDKGNAIKKMESSLDRLLVIAENDPNLKSNEVTVALINEFRGSRSDIAMERIRLNEKFKMFNVSIHKVPTRFVAKAFGFGRKNDLMWEKQINELPKVELE